jgi:hypothetical protein
MPASSMHFSMSCHCFLTQKMSVTILFKSHLCSFAVLPDLSYNLNYSLCTGPLFVALGTNPGPCTHYKVLYHWATPQVQFHSFSSNDFKRRECLFWSHASKVLGKILIGSYWFKCLSLKKSLRQEDMVIHTNHRLINGWLCYQKKRGVDAEQAKRSDHC